MVLGKLSATPERASRDLVLNSLMIEHGARTFEVMLLTLEMVRRYIELLPVDVKAQYRKYSPLSGLDLEDKSLIS